MNTNTYTAPRHMDDSIRKSVIIILFLIYFSCFAWRFAIRNLFYCYFIMRFTVGRKTETKARNRFFCPCIGLFEIVILEWNYTHAEIHAYNSIWRTQFMQISRLANRRNDSSFFRHRIFCPCPRFGHNVSKTYLPLYDLSLFSSSSVYAWDFFLPENLWSEN